MRIAHEFRDALVAAAIALVLAACGAMRPKPIPVVRFTAPTQHRHAVDANDVLFRAIGLVGTPYRYGGNTPRGGFDCSGLVDYVFRDVAGIVLPRTAEQISHIDAPEIPRNRLVSGDIVFFHQRGRQVSHVGIYVGKGRFVHAPNAGGTVRLDYLDSRYWKTHYSGAKRVPL